jgi:hypothetical protein
MSLLILLLEVQGKNVSGTLTDQNALLRVYMKKDIFTLGNYEAYRL